jgi:hypothetical protein
MPAQSAMGIQALVNLDIMGEKALKKAEFYPIQTEFDEFTGANKSVRIVR